ncbi:juvenile hormone epoxide hydrolase protein 3 [Danaus plexippus plexippus]|uniref:Glutathione peroxidase n=1 Tax=Danaus plexippus plexippus TaxID=278856 RepID=A0A212EU54_DANPL|nr:juvenile hormone epoxide hydrolase protein 3 [Danaus plexippus plexippus]
MTNKKDNKKKTSQDEKNKKEESGFSSGKIIFVSAICAALCSYYLYKRLTTPPDPPVLDFNEYWGPYPMKMDPDLSIRPYEIEFSEVMVNDLRERLLHRRPFQPPLENSGFTYGFNSHFLTRVLDYWQNKYNFKEREQFFNKYNHYVTNIQGLDVHYMHVKPQVPDDIEVVPLLLLHGWPGSVREFYELIPKLTSPRDDYKFAFEIIAPSLPGFGFSQAPSRPGFGPVEMSVVLSNLMKRIGHNKYYIQGGDFGHMLGSILATLMPEQVLGFHTNMPVLMFHPLANIYMMLGSLWPSLLVEPEQQSRVYPYSQYLMRIIEESGYLHIQATKPDTVVKEPQTIYDFTVRDIHGREIKLDKYRGKVVVIVNVASQCGLTDTNYHQLNELHDKYARSRDLRILAFPCNQFGGQEPGTAKDIAKFISDRNVKFDVFEKVAVNGDDAHPLFQFLKRVQRGSFGDYIKWNYSKFIVDRNGVPVERFGPHVDPIDLEPSLAKYW